MEHLHISIGINHSVIEDPLLFFSTGLGFLLDVATPPYYGNRGSLELSCSKISQAQVAPLVVLSQGSSGLLAGIPGRRGYFSGVGDSLSMMTK
jgi:hypothetical protein